MRYTCHTGDALFTNVAFYPLHNRGRLPAIIQISLDQPHQILVQTSGAHSILHLIQDFLSREGRSIRSLLRQRLEDIRSCHDTCLDIELVFSKVEGVTTSIQGFVMVGGPTSDLLKTTNLFQDLICFKTMLSDDSKLRRAQLSRLFQDLIRNHQFTDIM
jgi:hypothetical protein